MSTLILWVMVVGSLAAAWSDVRTRRIPNALTGALTGMALVAGAVNGPTGVGLAGLVMLLVFVVGTVVFSYGLIGGGDVKLLTACCGFASFPGCLQLLLYTLVAGALVSLVEALRGRRLRAVLTGAYQATRGVAPSNPTTVPYGVAIAAGTCSYALSTISAFHFLRLTL